MTEEASNQDLLSLKPALATASIAAPVELSIIVPTLNERENISPLLDRLKLALEGLSWEVVFVDDDSRDHTAAYVRSIAQSDARVRCMQRIGRRGLGTACIEGILATSAPFVAVMDADLQHDERILPQMLETLQREHCDVVVGSRYIAGGAAGGLDRNRRRISAFATWLSQVACKVEITDPMSGFFMFKRPAFEAAVRRMSGQGFKILLDLLASSPNRLAVKEIPYHFRERRFGESKLDTLVAWEFVMLIADKLVGHLLPVRFALFALIGGFGFIIHIATLGYFFKVAGLTFEQSQTVAVVVAMTSNFFLNNLFTYRDMRLRGWRILRGLLSFYLICAVGAVANVGIASYVFAVEHTWWLAGIVGVLIGAVWNYAVSSVFTWKR